ncbi:MAG TPA: TetR/AcrR family transcriptional regulator [Myxococcus sp.]|jgi:AcrR family transcriptional regulator|nr:TetR/AcrR family transcriptional regulator [Myxococcus sp.]
MATKGRKERARRMPLTPERVLGTALELADEKGLDWLSMRNLAQALKVEAMSLYNHVPSKEHILDGIVDLVAGELTLPRAGGDWKAAMRERAQSAHGVLMRHPWATLLFVSRLNVGPNMLRYVDATIGCLRAAGFTYPQADHAWNALDAYIYGFTLQRLNFPLDPTQYAAAASQFLPMIPPERFPHLNGMSQEIIAGRHDGVQHLELGLDILLDGLERMRTGG